MGVTEDKLLYLAETKRQIREAIESKGIAVTDGDTFRDYAVKIHAIDTGRDYGNPDYDDPVRFFDYDGTLLYSYSVNEFLALSFMPALPTCSGLICQGWNNSLTEAQEYVRDTGYLDIGAIYITDDGKSRFYIKIYDIDTPIRINFIQEANNAVIVDWGDGTPQEASPSDVSVVSMEHQYEATGEYCVSLEVLLGTITLGNGKQIANTNADYESFFFNERFFHSLFKVHIGNGVSLLERKALNSNALSIITLPNIPIRLEEGAITGQMTYMSLPAQLEEDSSVSPSLCINSNTLKTLSLNVWGTFSPIWISAPLERVFEKCTSTGAYSTYATADFSRKMFVWALPSNIKSASAEPYRGTIPFTELKLPRNLESLSLKSCAALQSLDIPESVHTLNLEGCSALTKIKIPKGVESFNATAFKYCSSLMWCDFSGFENIPKVGVGAFDSCPCKIIVPHWLYDDWVVSTNWDTYSSKIIKYIDISECTSLIITSAKDVVGNATTTKVQYRAVVNGTRYNGEYVTGVVVTGTGTSNEFPQNTSSNAITREISFTLGGRTATTTITHKKYRDLRIICTYKATSTSSNTQLLYSSFLLYSEYFEPMMTVDGSEVALANAYKFSTTGNHEVIFKVRTDAEITTLYNMFYGITTLTEVDFCDVDLSAVTGTATTSGTACLFYGCTGLTSVTFPDTIQYLGYRMFYNCKAMKNLTIPLSAAPEVYGADTFGSSSYWMGYNNRTAGTNKLRVPAGATGYDVAPWKSYVLSTSYCGFAIEEY